MRRKQSDLTSKVQSSSFPRRLRHLHHLLPSPFLFNDVPSPFQTQQSRSPSPLPIPNHHRTSFSTPDLSRLLFLPLVSSQVRLPTRTRLRWETSQTRRTDPSGLSRTWGEGRLEGGDARLVRRWEGEGEGGGGTSQEGCRGGLFLSQGGEGRCTFTFNSSSLFWSSIPSSTSSLTFPCSFLLGFIS